MDDEKNGKLSCESNGFIRMIDDSEISLHSSTSKISDEDAASRRGLCIIRLFIVHFISHGLYLGLTGLENLIPLSERSYSIILAQQSV